MEKQNVTTKENNKHPKILAEILSPLLWLFLIINTFVYDIVEYVINTVSPNLIWISDWKIIQISLMVLFVVVFVKTKHLLFFLFYPLIVFFWRIPRFIFRKKSWYFAIAMIKPFLSFFKHNRYWLITSCLFIISLAIIYRSKSLPIVYIFCFVIVLITIAEIVRNFITVMKQPKPLKIFEKIGSAMNKYIECSFFPDEELRATQVASFSEEQLKKWCDNLQSAVIANRLYLFVAKKIDNYRKSPFEYFSRFVMILLLALFIIASYSFVNQSLYLADNSLYRIDLAVQPNWFQFFFYSFCTATSQNCPISSSAPVIQTLVILETIEIFSLFFVLIGNLLSVWKKNYNDQMSHAIETLERNGNRLEIEIRENYEIENIHGAIEKLKELKSDMLSLVFYLTERI